MRARSDRSQDREKAGHSGRSRGRNGRIGRKGRKPEGTAPKRWLQWVQGIMSVLVLIVLILLSYMAASYVTAPGLRLLGLELQGLPLELANTFVSFVGMMALAASAGSFFYFRERKILNALIGAMRQMARGDFNIRLDINRKRAGDYGGIVDGIYHMAEELGQMERLRQEFISNVSHELQSPLTSISGFARALQKEGLGKEEHDHYLRIIEQESRRLSKLSDSLLKLTTLESEHQPFAPRGYRLDRQLRDVVLAGEPQWSAKELELELDMPELGVYADEELMSQVWTNLLHNSVKFTPEGGTIRIAAAGSEDRVEITFEDSGIGIEAEHVPHIFERFYKSDASRQRSAGGSGLGLSIVRKIVELHGGDITVHSLPGEGTTFKVSLPQNKRG
ncbi:sensor histidine kinase [Paenibacillus puerhi]|uniref:sensor histidine kinase n=1 Tax=Paenibacillus puerhi TaxID=2692622 RepID=UPI001F2E4E2B|nr:HAMP domain-containing sensor histidine kinase [Paenibacillus puerhi]